MSNRRHTLKLLFAGTASLAALSSSDLALAADVTYKYDDLGRLILATYPNGLMVSYAYDDAGNRSQVARLNPGPVTSTIQVTGIANLRTLANAAGYAGNSGVHYQFVVPAGTTITGAASGGIAISTGVWPAGANVSLVINGSVYGGGGKGGNGGYSASPTAGSAGGDAISCQCPLILQINASGTVKGAGGGGSGGMASFTGGMNRAGGGGGGGFPNGPAGNQTGPYAGVGGAGTVSGGGAGGYSQYAVWGGAGGGAGQAGFQMGSAAPGAAGFAVRKNGNAVILTNAGGVTGSVA